MFNNISWGSYCYALFVIVSFYYLVIVVLYYPHELKYFSYKWYNRFASRSMRDTDNQRPGIEESAVNTPLIDIPEPKSGDLNAIAPAIEQALMDELEAFFSGASKVEWSRDALIQSLRLIIAKYPTIRRSNYTTALNTYINLEVEHICSIHLTEEDRKLLWV